MSPRNAGLVLALAGLCLTACYDGASDGDSATFPGVTNAPTLTAVTSSGEPTTSQGTGEPDSTTGAGPARTSTLAIASESGTEDMSSGPGFTSGEPPAVTTGTSEEPPPPPDTTTGVEEPPPPPSCGELAGSQGWKGSLCEVNGNGACGGQGAATSDCEHCCAAPSCGQLAGQLGWGDDALCEQNGDGICKGTGQPTWDCQLCCDQSGLPGGGFGYPVGDRASSPAGGWSVIQVMAHYFASYGGRHLAHDVRAAGGGAATVNAPVYAVADGVVRYAGPNNSQYKHMILIEHQVAGEQPVCSFYGHINAPLIGTGATVVRGQQITSVMDWKLIENGGSTGNTHLHYGIIRKGLCDASAAAKGALICGYDKGGANGVVDLATEPSSYQPINDPCNDSQYGDVFLSPTKFIDAHHF